MTSLIIGSESDVHVQAVTSSMKRLDASPPIIMDAQSLQDNGFYLSQTDLKSGEFGVGEGGRGWLRRYAPSSWGMGIVAGSVDAGRFQAVSATSSLSFSTGLRNPRVLRGRSFKLS
jgi:hypothetical protein